MMKDKNLHLPVSVRVCPLCSSDDVTAVDASEFEIIVIPWVSSQFNASAAVVPKTNKDFGLNSYFGIFGWPYQIYL